MAASAFVALPLAASGEIPAPSVTLTQPVTTNVLENKATVDGDRKETTSKIELVGSNGAVHRITGYILHVEREESYDTTIVMTTEQFQSTSDKVPVEKDVRVTIIQGEKGVVDGDSRLDEIQTTSIGPEGVIKGPVTMRKKLLVDPYKDLSTQDKAQAILDARLKHPKTE